MPEQSNRLFRKVSRQVGQRSGGEEDRPQTAQQFLISKNPTSMQSTVSKGYKIMGTPIDEQTQNGRHRPH